MLESLNCAAFVPYLNQTFQFSDGVSTLDAELSEAKSPGPSPNGGRDPFALIFLAQYPPVWPQRIYRVSHPELGTYDIFLVPIGPDPKSGGMRYEAIFS